MLNRNDLVKQFELVVQQEIKNHNDQILASNLAVNDLKDIFQIHRNAHSALSNKFVSEMSRINVELDDLREKISQTVIFMNSFINDLRTLNQRNSEKLDEKNETIQSLTKNIESHEDKIQKLSEGINKNRKEVAKLGDIISENLQQLEKKHKCSLNDLKEEILNRPSEALQVKSELSEKMSTDRVDFEGVMRELQLLKKDNLIKEKKIEKLFILIERLEQKKES